MLLPAATWAAPAFAPFARMAAVLAVRRGLAEAVRRHWLPTDEVAAPEPAPPPAPAPPPVFVPAPVLALPPGPLLEALFAPSA